MYLNYKYCENVSKIVKKCLVKKGDFVEGHLKTGYCPLNLIFIVDWGIFYPKPWLFIQPPPPPPHPNPKRSRTADFTAGEHIIIELKGFWAVWTKFFRFLYLQYKKIYLIYVSLELFGWMIILIQYNKSNVIDTVLLFSMIYSSFT